MVPKDQNNVVPYIYNYINQDQFDELYNLNWIEKNLQNIDIILSKIRLALIRAINYRIDNARKKKQKREQIIKRQKAEAMAAKHCKARRKLVYTI